MSEESLEGGHVQGGVVGAVADAGGVVQEDPVVADRVDEDQVSAPTAVGLIGIADLGGHRRQNKMPIAHTVEQLRGFESRVGGSLDAEVVSDPFDERAIGEPCDQNRYSCSDGYPSVRQSKNVAGLVPCSIRGWLQAMSPHCDS
ncbi:hypothetical protein [Leifsonia soli]|uniref:hypothetical protein n=1 Tax=Leifsonia soli TaxID=582665 RepID=UPI001C538468|nr:hypothetical protein [Leifsonia soli]